MYINNPNLLMNITDNENDINDILQTRNVCNMSLTSFSSAVIFFIRLFSTSAFRVPSLFSYNVSVYKYFSNFFSRHYHKFPKLKV